MTVYWYQTKIFCDECIDNIRDMVKLNDVDEIKFMNWFRS